MEVFGYLGFGFGLVGLSGFSLAMSATKRLDKLESEIAELRKTSKDAS